MESDTESASSSNGRRPSATNLVGSPRVWFPTIDAAQSPATRGRDKEPSLLDALPRSVRTNAISRISSRRVTPPGSSAAHALLANAAPPASPPLPGTPLATGRMQTTRQAVPEQVREGPAHEGSASNRRPRQQVNDRDVQQPPRKRLRLTLRIRKESATSRDSGNTANPSPPADQAQPRPQQERPVEAPNAPAVASPAAQSQLAGRRTPGASEPRTARDGVPCDECNVVFGDADAVKRHKRSQHPPITSLTGAQCQICKLVLKSKRNLVRHSRVHGDNAFLPCMECCAWFITECSRTRHRRIVHGENIPRRRVQTQLARCPAPDCNFSSNQLSNIKRHFESIHLQLRRHACDVEGCSYRATTKGNLEAHKISHRTD